MPASAYLRFAAAHKRFVSFGFAMALTSSFGQTYFIGVFGPSLQAEFDLSHTSWSSVYLLGTLASALLLPWTGRLIDQVDLGRYTLAVLALLTTACGFMAGAVTGVVTLTVAIFLLRHAGQGLASHTSVTSMSRYYTHNRGLAIAIATLGFAAGEAVLPVAAVTLIAEAGWRWSYAAIAVVIALVATPYALWAVGGPGAVVRGAAAAEAAVTADTEGASSTWTRADVLRDARFYLLLPGLLAPALVITALFFHHLTIAADKGWSAAWITGNYVAFAGASTVTALACGPLIDRFGGVRLAPYMLLPLAAGLAVLASVEQHFAVPLYFSLIGLSVGMAHTAVAALWAELYGVQHLGAIRSMVTALAVFSSALGPITMGWLMDKGVAINVVLLGFACYCLLGCALIGIALRPRTRR